MLGGIRAAGVRPGFTAVLESRGTAVRSDRASGNGWAPGSATVPDEFPGRIPWPIGPGEGLDEGLLLRTKLIDAELDLITRFEKNRWFHAQTDSRRSARRNEVSRFEKHELREVMNQVEGVENHGFGVSGLPAFPVHRERHF